MLVAAALVVTMIVWMNRAARNLRQDIERRVETYAQQSTRAAGWAIGLFVFFMVVREGAELVLILRAVELSSAGVQVSPYLSIVNVYGAKNPAGYAFDYGQTKLVTVYNGSTVVSRTAIADPVRNSIPNFPFLPTVGVHIAY